MPDISIKITNLPQIKAAFGKSPQIMSRELNSAIKKTIFNISRDSRVNTPVDTGTLRRSTYERFASMYGEVGTNTPYDIFVHSGTRFMQARPYLQRAVDSNRVDTLNFFTQAVQRTLDQIGRMT